MYKISYLTGVKKIEPVRYWITIDYTIKGIWPFRREVKQYWIECEFSLMGPYNSRDEAEQILLNVRRI